ncbi:hypothetical protein ES703_84386 [subsurface metagenome]
MKEVQNNLTQDLIRASAGYARAGLALLHITEGFVSNPQVAIGNLAIAIELLLKAFIAKQSLLLLFKNLPLELRCAIAAPKAMPESFRKTPYEIDLKASAYKSLELDEAITSFGLFFPAMKKRLASHLRFLSRHRNTCVHAALPDFREYEMERTAFLFLTLVEHLKEKEPELLNPFDLGEDKLNKQFLERFDEERLKRVHSKIEAAREKAKKLTEKLSLSSDDWNWYPVACPVCGSDGILTGETEPEKYDNGKGGFEVTTILFFTGETFKCEQCGLTLSDFDELKIAGIDPDVDRSNEAIRWLEEQYQDEEDNIKGFVRKLSGIAKGKSDVSGNLT